MSYPTADPQISRFVRRQVCRLGKRACCLRRRRPSALCSPPHDAPRPRSARKLFHAIPRDHLQRRCDRYLRLHPQIRGWHRDQTHARIHLGQSPPCQPACPSRDSPIYLPRPEPRRSREYAIAIPDKVKARWRFHTLRGRDTTPCACFQTGRRGRRSPPHPPPFQHRFPFSSTQECPQCPRPAVRSRADSSSHLHETSQSAREYYDPDERNVPRLDLGRGCRSPRTKETSISP